MSACVPTQSSASQPVQWGILGTGVIAHRFAADFVHVTDARLVAVGSRNGEKARAFGNTFGIPHQYGSYRELANDPDVHAVYIATPASTHKADIELCLRAGKAVLCEKPLTVNVREAEDVIALARLNRVFLMEAMWTRFLPLVIRLRKLLARRVVGEIRHVMADLGSHVTFDPDSRVYNEGLGGGGIAAERRLSAVPCVHDSWLANEREKFIGSREDRGRRGHRRTVGVSRRKPGHVVVLSWGARPASRCHYGHSRSDSHS
jgi:hypothetical protein